ncbi:MAG TPA: TIGR01906 family membrane protein [Candidatus Onthovivens sp.]|nr:TIGR01906 family membrane protein [Candidatus Onthovivens sp.]
MIKLRNYSLNILLGLSFTLFILTFSISLPILIRGFYYIHIESTLVLEVLEYWNGLSLTVEDIKESYNLLLDFLIFNKPFDLGKIPFTYDGMMHFYDVRTLFIFNFSLLGASATSLIVLLTLLKFRVFELVKFKKLSFFSIVPLILLVFGGCLAIYALIDFNGAFTFFHLIFFPTKTNWFFDYRIDPIINIFQVTFFQNCAILIGSICLISYGIPLFIDIKTLLKEKKISKTKN